MDRGEVRQPLLEDANQDHWAGFHCRQALPLHGGLESTKWGIVGRAFSVFDSVYMEQIMVAAVSMLPPLCPKELMV